MKEFRINEYLSLRLERGKTRVYIAGQAFIQCKFLLLNIPITDLQSFDEIDSIDEVAEKVDGSKEKEIRTVEIPPEVEFWGHCSNLQVWYEHNYDTRLIHSNIAFPILQKLTEVGDTLAKEVFRAEILDRYRNGSQRTRYYLAAEGFLKFLSLDEILNILLNNQDFIGFMRLVEEIWPDQSRDFISSLIGNFIKIENREIIEIDLSQTELNDFPISVLNFTNLRILDLSANYIGAIPEDIGHLDSLIELRLNGNEIKNIPDSICSLKKLEKLHLGDNKLVSLPICIGNLKSLKYLYLGENQLDMVPSSISKLSNLIKIDLSYNQFKEIPKVIRNLKIEIDISKNPID